MRFGFLRSSLAFLAVVSVVACAVPAFSQALPDIYPEAQTNYLPGTFVVLANPDTKQNYLATITGPLGDTQQGYVYASVVDTGSSGNVICATEAQGRNLPLTGETYSDVGIGGTEEFYVSGSTTVKLAAVDSGAIDDSYNEHLDKFNTSYGDYKLQVRESDPKIDTGLGFDATIMINTIGTPILNQNVMHVRSGTAPFPYYMDDVGIAPVNYVPTDVVSQSSLAGTLTAASSQLVLVPKVGGTASAVHVPLVYKDFIDYNLNPTPAPSVATNPTIPNVSLVLGTKTEKSDWLFDSGSAITMMGRDQATSLGIDLSQPGVTSTTVLGIGGSMPTFQGYQIDKLVLSTADGNTLSFDDIIVFVPGPNEMPADLPGIFGMNLLDDAFQSMDADTGEPIDLVSSAFSDWYVVPAAVPEPTTFVLLAVAASIFLIRRRFARCRG